MASQTINPASKLTGRVAIPGDKSVSHRAFLIGGLSNGRYRVTHWLRADDVGRSRTAMAALGVASRDQGDAVEVEGQGLESLRAPVAPLDMGNSGTTTRLLMGILAGCPFKSELFGDDSLSKRPMKRVTAPLSQMGARFEGPKGTDFLPLSVNGGKLKGIRYELPVASAQVKSALLLAGLYAEGPTTVIEPLPTRDHTERMLEYLGAKLTRNGPQITIHPGDPLKARDLRVPGDFSSAAFFLVAGSIVPGSKITVEGVGLNPTRTALLTLLKRMGAEIAIQMHPESGPEPIGDLTVSYRPLKAIEVEPELVPNAIDEIPILTVAATQAEGVTRITGAAELRVKETDRIRSMVAGLSAMGAKIKAEGDSLIVEGPTPLKGAAVESFGDHRTAMALAVAALTAKGNTVISGSEWVTISFPDFFDRLAALQSGVRD
jgi:3-phosphoshikimate 1-carboxyvinyltransferase